MRVLITEFMSLDGVVQAPGGPKEDTDGGFEHGGWSMKYFDPDVMGGTYDELAKPLRRSVLRLDQRRPEVRGVGHADRRRHHLETDGDHSQRRPGEQGVGIARAAGRLHLRLRQPDNGSRPHGG